MKPEKVKKNPNEYKIELEVENEESISGLDPEEEKIQRELHELLKNVENY